MRHLQQRPDRGFTLIELLVVIAIIGLLASIILVALNGARDKARKAKARAEISQIVRAAQLARILNQSTLNVVTGSNCTYCGGQATTVTTLNTISSRSGIPGLTNLATDPWGGYYAIDENETENVSTNCSRDVIYASNGDYSVRYKLDYWTSYCKANPVGSEGWQADI